jgi:hypothetical protein
MKENCDASKCYTLVFDEFDETSLELVGVPADGGLEVVFNSFF